MSKKSTVVLHKKRGETPLEVLNAWKASHTELQDVPMSYAGRLDPMAEGKLLVLVGEECKKQGKYTKLDKEYEIEVLVGIKTDTGDVLGITTFNNQTVLDPTALAVLDKKTICKVLQNELGSHSRKYPVFSSKTVQGKPLFLYSLEGTINSITIPEHIERMYRFSNISLTRVTLLELQKRINDALAIVPRSDEPSKLLGADFRQDEVRAKWQELFSKVPAQDFMLLKLTVTCGSGAYMRTLAERIGTTLGSTAFALSINRKKIGKYLSFSNSPSIGIWLKQYSYSKDALVVPNGSDSNSIGA